MIAPGDFLVLLAAMAGASFFCRAVGFLAMRFVPMTPRFEAALRATPAAVMGGIVAIALVNGGPVEWISAAAVVVLMKITGHDILSAFAGIGLVAMLRAFGL